MKIGKQKQECCGQCPFARSTPKEYLDTRGDNGERFIGQAHSASLLPCHMANPDGIADPTTGQPQCAGAAMYRANVGITGLPPALGTLPPNHEEVFSHPVELLAHHKGWPLGFAHQWMEAHPPELLAHREVMTALGLGRVDITPR